MSSHPDPAVEAQVDSFLHQTGIPGASVGLVADARLAWSRHGGVSDLSGGRQPDDRTLYRIASITKTFTATAIMQLRDEGRISLDDPVLRHLPEFADVRNPFGAVEQITLDRILRHLSGLPGEMPSEDPWRWRPTGGPGVLKALDSVVVAIPPGTAFKYSNLGYHLLGEVVARVSGRTLGEYLRAEITGVLSMDSTTFEPGGSLAHDVATGYDRGGNEGSPSPARRLAVGESEGNGGLWSTVADLALWIGQQFRQGDAHRRGPGQVLDGRSLVEMQRPVVVAEPDLTAGQGLGWRVTRLGDTTIVEHGGLLNGFSSSIQLSPTHKLGVIVLTNGVSTSTSPTTLGRDILAEQIRQLPELPGMPIDRRPTPGPWRELVGRYVEAEFRGVAFVAEQGGELVFRFEADPIGHVLASTGDPLRFTLTSGRPAGEALVFLRDAAGRVAGLNFAGFPLIRLDAVS